MTNGSMKSESVLRGEEEEEEGGEGLGPPLLLLV